MAVIVQPAHQPRVQLVADVESLEAVGHGGKEIAALLVQIFTEARRLGHQRAVALVLGIEDAQRVALQPLAAVGGELLLMRLEIADQGGAIGRAALAIAQRVELEHRTIEEAEVAQDRRPAGDDLHIAGRPRHAEELEADLMELALAALLRTLIAEHRTGVEIFQRQMLAEAAGDEGAGHAGRVLGPERQLLATLVGEGVHLLRDDVGGIAQGALEDLREFEDRGRHLEIAISFRRRARGLDHAPVTAHVFRQEVMCAPNGLQRAHDGRSVPGLRF